jgi:hypothetical protein
MILIFATPEEARELLGLSTRQTEILRPQTSGPCVHYDERSEHAADAYPCTYPYGDEHSDGVCPHLDNPDILCPSRTPATRCPRLLGCGMSARPSSDDYDERA